MTVRSVHSTRQTPTDSIRWATRETVLLLALAKGAWVAFFPCGPCRHLQPTPGEIASQNLRPIPCRKGCLAAAATIMPLGASNAASGAVRPLSRLCCNIDAGLELAFTPSVTNRIPLSASQFTSAFFRLVLVLAVAVAATFQACCLTATQTSQAETYIASDHDASDRDTSTQVDLAGEQCSLCAVAALPAMVPVAEESFAETVAQVRDLAPFHPRPTSPPPRI